VTVAEGVRSYPPVGDPDRLDEIMRRGRALRRRRQLGVGAGAGGAAVAVLAAVLLVTGPADTDRGVVADGDRDEVATTTSTTTTSLPEVMQARIDEDAGGALTVTVLDPRQPALDASLQCVTVTVLDAAGELAASGHGCNDGPGDATAVPVTVTPVDPMLAVSACAPSIAPADPDAPTPDTRLAVSTFELVGPELPPGTYTVEVDATSGRGDGCPGVQPGSDEIENQASATFAAWEVS
jgi:hypothetical protein